MYELRAKRWGVQLRDPSTGIMRMVTPEAWVQFSGMPSALRQDDPDVEFRMYKDTEIARATPAPRRRWPRKAAR